jgi:uncharacterized phage protein (TIGR02218 family)
MKSCSAGFLTMLTANNYLVKADLIGITLASGTSIYLTDAPVNITVNGHTYLCAVEAGSVPGFRRGPTRMAIGLQAETLDVTLLYDPDTLISGQAPGAFANAGGFDYATVRIDKFLSTDFATVTNGTINLFDGVITDVEAQSTKIMLTAATDMIYLNAAFPRNYFLATCNNSLFDVNCGLAKATWKVGAVAVTTSTKVLIHSNSLAQASGYFALGYIVITSGVNSGITRMVKKFLSGDVYLLYPLPVACGVGDTYDIYPGCDKTLGSNGCAKFSNTARSRMFPDVPTPELITMGGSSSTGAPTDNTGGGYGGGGGTTGPGGSNNSFKVY